MEGATRALHAEASLGKACQISKNGSRGCTVISVQKIGTYNCKNKTGTHEMSQLNACFKYSYTTQYIIALIIGAVRAASHWHY
jgi:hypothetical protein